MTPARNRKDVVSISSGCFRCHRGYSCPGGWGGGKQTVSNSRGHAIGPFRAAMFDRSLFKEAELVLRAVIIFTTCVTSRTCNM